MIIPSIDILNGRAVQLVGGKKDESALDLGDPIALAERFRVAGEVAVVDLDAAMGTGSNEAMIRSILARAPCRVGGGIRTVEKAIQYLDWGASKVILGTMARPEILIQLPRSRVIAALDESRGKVVVEGWQRSTAFEVDERMAALKDFVSGFLLTSVDREGKEQGIDRELLERLRKYGGMDRTIAGGVVSPEEIRLADEAGVNTQVGMAFHTGKLHLGEAIAAPLKPSDRPDGLWPTVVADEDGRALGLVYSSRESLKMAVELRRGVYHSRRRGVWIKGADSGNTQDLLRIDLDCDRDAIRFTVRQHGAGFCHTGRYGCWGDAEGLKALERRIGERIATPEAGSYTARLLTEPGLLGAKLIEEAQELDGARGENVAEEAADLFYFGLVALARSGVSLCDVERILDRRSRKVTRRPGDAKRPLTNGRKSR